MHTGERRLLGFGCPFGRLLHVRTSVGVRQCHIAVVVGLFCVGLVVCMSPLAWGLACNELGREVVRSGAATASQATVTVGGDTRTTTAAGSLPGSRDRGQTQAPTDDVYEDMLGPGRSVGCLRVVLGIFTTAREVDRRRQWRALLARDTSMNVAGYVDVRHVELPDGRHEWHVPPVDCGLSFVFVMGRNKTTGAMPELQEDDWRGLVVLNITENMNDGKSYAWWRWVAANIGGAAHAVSKQDSDTRLCPPRLFAFLRATLQDGNVRGTYIGNLVDFINCGRYEHCPRGWVYASGGMHFLTTDLVAAITAQRFDLRDGGTALRSKHEDLITGKMLIDTGVHYKFANIASEAGRMFKFQSGDLASTRFLSDCTPLPSVQASPPPHATASMMQP